jgi:hypothetical protein
MQSKVCLVLFSLGNFNRTWTQILRNLGIDYTLCIATSSTASATIQTPQGVFAASSADLRNYFRQFDAVILCDNSGNLSDSSLINYSVFWMSWNAPDDPAFLFFNPHFSTAITESAYNSNFPSDFPIVRPNPSDIAGTLYAADGGSPSPFFPLVVPHFSGRGACVLFPTENIRAHVMTICNTHTNNIPYYWRLDTAKHSTLASTTYTHRVARNGRAGEILAVPAPPTNAEDTETYGSDCVVAYRYRNIFWLPHAMARTQRAVNFWDAEGSPFVFWLLYGLQLAGVRPRYKLPVQMETDHPIESFASTPPFNLSYRQQMEALLAKHDYMREFARRTGTAIIHGVRVGGRHRTTSASYHWQMMYNTGVPTDARAVAQQINQLLVAGHREGTTPCGVHDHTAGNFQGGYWLGDVRANFRRHSGMRYGAPADVPISRGRCCVAPHVLPSGVAPESAITVQIGDAEMVEWDHTMSGTGDTFDLPLGNIHAARVIIESEIEEMLALGFPDGYCAGHKYTNTAANASGGECYWQALKEFGFRGVRSSSACNAPHNTKRVAPNRLWHGFHLITDVGFDLAGGGVPYAYGLYHPDSPSRGDGVRYWQLDHGNDISANWTTSAVAAWRAYRRVVCQGIGNWLFTTAVALGAFYIHPINSAMILSLSDPNARFNGWSVQNVIGHPHYNHEIELLENMDAVVRLLPDILYWGTITDVMDLRERVLGD